MAFRKISELSSSLTPSGSGIIPIVINGTTFGTTLDAIKDQINSVLTPQYASSSITSSVDTLIGNVSSLNTFTSSADGRLDSIEIFTGSLNDYYATDQELLELREYFNTYSSSNNTVNTQQNIRLDALDGLEIATGSLLTQIETEKGRIDAILLSSDADKDSFKEIVDLINSVDTENDNAFGTYVLNTNDRLDSIEVESGSIRSEFNSYTSSANNILQDHELQRWLHGERLTSIETFTGSLSDTVNDIKGRLDKLEIESGSIRDEFNSFTSSYLIVSQSFNDRISILEGYHIPQPTPNATPNPTSTPNATPQPTPNATPVPTVEYELYTTYLSRDEGQSAFFELRWTNGTSGATVGFTLSGTATPAQEFGGMIEAMDYTKPTDMFFTVNNSGFVILEIPINEDSQTEGTETIILTLDAQDSNGNPTGGLQKTVTINDTSELQNWEIVTSTHDEGITFNHILKTEHVPAGTEYYWYVGVGIGYPWTPASAADFVGGVLPSGSGTIPVYNETLAISDSIPVSIVADSLTEGDEVYQIIVKDGSPSDPGQHRVIMMMTITDSSLTPVTTPTPTPTETVDIGSFKLHVYNQSSTFSITDFKLVKSNGAMSNRLSFDSSGTHTIQPNSDSHHSVITLDTDYNNARISIPTTGGGVYYGWYYLNGSLANQLGTYSFSNLIDLRTGPGGQYQYYTLSSSDVVDLYITETNTPPVPNPTATVEPTPNPTPTPTVEPDPTPTPTSTVEPVNFTVRFQLDGGNSTYSLKDLSIPQSFGNTHNHAITGYDHDGFETVNTNVVANNGYTFNGNDGELTYTINGSPISNNQGNSTQNTYGFFTTYNSVTDSWDLLIQIGSVGSDLITEGEIIILTIGGNAIADPTPTPTETVAPPSPTSTPEPDPTPDPTATPNATPNPTPTSTVAPPSPTSTVGPLQNILMVTRINSLPNPIYNTLTGNFSGAQQFLCDNTISSGLSEYRQTSGDPTNPQNGDMLYHNGSLAINTQFGFFWNEDNNVSYKDTWRWITTDSNGVMTVSQFNCPTSTPVPDPTATPNATPNPTPTSTPINYYLRTNYSSNMGSTRISTDPNSPVSSFGESYGTTEGESLSTMVYLHLGLGSDNLDYTVTVNGNPYNNGDTIDGVDGPITITPSWDGIPGSSNRIFGIYSYVLNPINKVYNIDVTVVPLPTSTPVPTSTPNATPNPTPNATPDPTPTNTVAPPSPTSTSTPETDYTQFDYFLTWRRNPVANGMTYDFTRLDGNTNDYFYSNEQIKCVYETFGNGGGNFWNIAVGDNSEGLISVGDNSWNNVSLFDHNVLSSFNNTTRAVWNDANDRMGNGPQHYIITFVSGEVTNLVSFDSIGDVSGCTPYTDPAPTSTPNSTPNPTATVAPPSPTSTVAPISCISAAPLNINVESEYDSNSNTTTFKYITSDLDGNGGLFGCINVDRGSTVTINVTGSAPNLETHPIKITNINDQGQHEAPLPNVVSTWNAGDPYTLTWEVPCDVGITQYQYQCVNHAHMRGVINVSGTCPTPTPSPTSTPNATPNPTPTSTVAPTGDTTTVNISTVQDFTPSLTGLTLWYTEVSESYSLTQNQYDDTLNWIEVGTYNPIADCSQGNGSSNPLSITVSTPFDGITNFVYVITQYRDSNGTVIYGSRYGSMCNWNWQQEYHLRFGLQRGISGNTVHDRQDSIYPDTLSIVTPTSTPNATPNPTPANNTIYVHTP